MQSLPQNHRAFLRLTRPIALVEGTAVLAAPNEFAKDYLENRLRPVIAAALSAELGRDIRVAVTVQHVEDYPDSADSPESLELVETPVAPALERTNDWTPARPAARALAVAAATTMLTALITSGVFAQTPPAPPAVIVEST